MVLALGSRRQTLIIARDMPALQVALAALPRPRALVATMGGLHAGHVALVDAARTHAPGGVIASVFVNPRQFGVNEDLSRYPRSEAADLAMLSQAGCDVAWLPPVVAMYPADAATRITVEGPALGFEGAVRPGHFAGVATVVTKLLNQTAPDLALFGEKDWQQVQVVMRLVADLDMPTRIVAVPTVRDADGLALSTRNQHLTAPERAIAALLYTTLLKAANAIAAGGSVADAEEHGLRTLRSAGFAPDYLRLADATTLKPQDVLHRPARLMAAARLGSVRLLDNVGVAPA